METKRVPWEDVKHAADVDLRMVQVGAVAVGREALRLAAEVDAGRIRPERAQAVMVSCLAIPVVEARRLVSGGSGTRAAQAQLSALLARLPREARAQAHSDGTWCVRTERVLGQTSPCETLAEGLTTEQAETVVRSLEGFFRAVRRMVREEQERWGPADAPLTTASDSPDLEEAYAEAWKAAPAEERELAGMLYDRRYYYPRLHARADVPSLDDCPAVERMDWLEVARTVRAFVRNGPDSISESVLVNHREHLAAALQQQSAPTARGVRHE